MSASVMSYHASLCTLSNVYGSLLRSCVLDLSPRNACLQVLLQLSLDLDLPTVMRPRAA